jgi:hypothetical protein
VFGLFDASFLSMCSPRISFTVRATIVEGSRIFKWAADDAPFPREKAGPEHGLKPFLNRPRSMWLQINVLTSTQEQSFDLGNKLDYLD